MKKFGKLLAIVICVLLSMVFLSACDLFNNNNNNNSNGNNTNNDTNNDANNDTNNANNNMNTITAVFEEFGFTTTFLDVMGTQTLTAVTLDAQSISVWLYTSNSMADIGFNAAQNAASAWTQPASAGRDGLIVWWGTPNAIEILNYARGIGERPNSNESDSGSNIVLDFNAIAAYFPQYSAFISEGFFTLQEMREFYIPGVPSAFLQIDKRNNQAAADSLWDARARDIALEALVGREFERGRIGFYVWYGTVDIVNRFENSTIITSLRQL